MSRRVLFVDDEERAFRLWGKPLTRHGWEVDHALDPADARRKLDAASRQTDRSYVAVIIDRLMPTPEQPALRDVFVGDRFLEEVVARWWYVCPIMLTNYAHIDAAASATRYGAYRYLVKGEATVEDIHRVLIKGVSSQSVRNDRYRCLAAPNSQVAVEEAIEVLKARYLQSLDLDVRPRFYRVLKSNELLRKRDDVECESHAGNTAQFEFGQLSPLLAEQLATQPFVFLGKNRDEPQLKEVFPAGEARSQLLIPVSVARGDHPSSDRSLEGVLSIECPHDDAREPFDFLSFGGVSGFDREDIDIFLTVASWIRDVLAVEARLSRVRSEAQARERHGLLRGIANQWSAPLQASRHHLDMLLSYLETDREIPATELHDRLSQALVGCQSALRNAAALDLESRPPNFAPVEVDLGAFVQEQVNAIRPEVERLQINLEPFLPHRPVRVVVDPLHLRRALETVLRTGLAAVCDRRAGPGDDADAGTLTILVEPTPSDREVLLSICDDGPRIDPRDVDRVFDRYADVRRVWRSPGDFATELYRVKEFIEAARGTIEVVPVAGDFGTEFRILLPIAGRQ